MKRKRSQYVIGIDLGTTNCAVSYIDSRTHPMGGPGAIKNFSIPQLVGEGDVSNRSGLPSFLYLAAGHDLPEGSLDLPWAGGRDFAVGEFAFLQGAKVPGRLVASAKSWLCHPGVDRNSAILPWGDTENIPKRSPVDVSSLYLRHMADAWDHLIARGAPGKKFTEQEIILTVPASFDEVARELTLEAAQKAGLEHITLLEEPQAAFYSWIDRHHEDWDEIIHPGMVILICDIGGGTTDFTLIRIKEGEAAPVPERIAVGEHLLLGGDNMDLALAHLVESRLMGPDGKRLDSLRWQILTSLCRSSKERILADGGIKTVPINLPGRGRGVVAGTLSDSLSLADVEEIIIKGFFPKVKPDEMPGRRAESGIQEWGLPYVADPIIPRHLAAFLRKHQTEHSVASQTDTASLLRPDAIFFNGGVFTPLTIQERIVQILSEWFPSASPNTPWPLVLENDLPALAVARGAAYYGMVRRGRGVRIVGGTARSYYIRVVPPDDAREEPGQITAVCVIPRGMQEGEEVELQSPEFRVLTNKPASFSIYHSNARTADPLGRVLTIPEDSLSQLPPLRTTLKVGKKGIVRKIPIHLHAHLTEIGTLELACVSKETNHRWRLKFQIRSEIEEKKPEGSHERGKNENKSIPEETVAQAIETVKLAFGEGKSFPGKQATPTRLVKELREKIGTNKERWPIPVLRRLSDALLEIPNHRNKSARHEERWLNLTGFCLRPGYGYEADDWRILEIWKIYHSGVAFANDRQCRLEWWILWRRVAGGLTQNQQTELFRSFSQFLLSDAKKAKKQPRVTPHERTEMWRTVANLERLPVEMKVKIGAQLMDDIGTARGEGLNMWVLARLASRIPLYGPLNSVIPGQTVTEWIKRILATKWQKPEQTAFYLVNMACFTGDREIDIDESLRDAIRERLVGLEDGEALTQRLYEVVTLSAEDEDRVFGEALPEGLHLA